MQLEAQVQERLDRGDARGAAVLAIRGLGPQLLRYLRATLRNEDDAADAFSRVAERIWLGISSFQRRSSLHTWALRIAWHAALDVRDDAWKRRARPLPTSEASLLADRVRKSSLREKERRSAALERLRSALSPEEQDLLVLRVDQRLSWAEIADVLSEGAEPRPTALMKRFERLKRRVARMARDEGLVE